MALEIAKSGIRVNGVAPGPTDTGMLTRFTATPENKAALAAEVPMGASASRRSLPTRSSSSRRTKLHSSPAISSTSTAVTPSTEGNSGSRLIDRDCATQSTMTSRTNQRPGHIKRSETNGRRGEETQHFF